MTRTRIKICGVCDEQIAKIAVDAGADMVGLVFVERSPRFVTVEQAKRIAASLPEQVTPVGLFVNASNEHIRDIAEIVGLETVQLHGDETPEQIVDLEPLNIIKSVIDNNQLARFMTCAHAVIFDAPPQCNELPGGTGRTFDWDALAQLDHSDWPNLFVAGGLTPQNVGQAIQIIHPYAVDVSSGVESKRGVKDAALIRDFCQAVHTADENQ
jgi:phosphoribosylanthranilate isomerase